MFGVKFLFNDTSFLQRNVVALGSPFAPLLVGIFKSKLETQILHKTISVFDNCYRYLEEIFHVTDKEVDLENNINVF